MDFLGAVNRVLVNNTIIKGDDDLVLTFSDAQHEATIRFARNSITSELNNLTSFFSIDREKTAGTVVTVALQDVVGIPPETATSIVAVAVAWIVGDSLRPTE